jgi:hypothetical protein
MDSLATHPCGQRTFGLETTAMRHVPTEGRTRKTLRRLELMPTPTLNPFRNQIQSSIRITISSPTSNSILVPMLAAIPRQSQRRYPKVPSMTLKDPHPFPMSSTQPLRHCPNKDRVKEHLQHHPLSRTSMPPLRRRRTPRRWRRRHRMSTRALSGSLKVSTMEPSHNQLHCGHRTHVGFQRRVQRANQGYLCLFLLLVSQSRLALLEVSPIQRFRRTMGRVQGTVSDRTDIDIQSTHPTPLIPSRNPNRRRPFRQPGNSFFNLSNPIKCLSQNSSMRLLWWLHILKRSSRCLTWGMQTRSDGHRSLVRAQVQGWVKCLI